jgi:hypothetical protein
VKFKFKGKIPFGIKNSTNCNNIPRIIMRLDFKLSNIIVSTNEYVKINSEKASIAKAVSPELLV